MGCSETIFVKDQRLLALLRSEFCSSPARSCTVKQSHATIVVHGSSEKALKPIVRSIRQALQIFEKISKI